jgi:hypothetical protein
MNLQRREKVYYKYRGGWGGGEIRSAFAMVVSSRQSTATIALLNKRTNKVEVKIVPIRCLEQRIKTSFFDAIFNEYLDSH